MLQNDIIQSSKPQKEVNLDKTWIKICLVPLKAQFHELLPQKKSIEVGPAQVSLLEEKQGKRVDYLMMRLVISSVSFPPS